MAVERTLAHPLVGVVATVAVPAVAAVADHGVDGAKARQVDGRLYPPGPWRCYHGVLAFGRETVADAALPKGADPLGFSTRRLTRPVVTPPARGTRRRAAQDV